MSLCFARTQSASGAAKKKDEGPVTVAATLQPKKPEVGAGKGVSNKVVQWSAKLHAFFCNESKKFLHDMSTNLDLFGTFSVALSLL